MSETSAAPGSRTGVASARTTWEGTEDRRSLPHTRIDNRIIDLYGERIGAIVLAVYLVLCRFADAVTRQCHPSIRRIAEMLGISRPTTLKAIAKLEEVGLVKVERGCPKQGKRQVNAYTLLPIGDGQTALPPLVNDVDQGGKAALPEQDLINNTQENKSARAPTGRAPAPARPCDPTLEHPAVKAYRGVCELTPNAAQAAAIAAVVTDMDTWQEVLNTWLLRNWSRANVEGMLDRYKRSILEGSGGNGRHAGIRRDALGGRFGFQGNRAYDQRESRPPETPDERARRDAEWAMLVKNSQNRSQHDEA